MSSQDYDEVNEWAPPMAASRRRFDKHATHFRPGTTSSRRNAFAPISGLQNPPDAIIAVMGKTGSGKSSFISKLAVDDYVNAVGHKLKSETQNVYEVSCVAGGHNILLIDTPGFDDTNAETGTILKRIADWLQEYSHEKKLLNGLIYCHDITDSRFGGSSVKNLTLFEKLTGQDSMKNVVLLSTKWDGIDQETGEQRDQELKSTPSFWKIMLADGAKALRHNGTKTSAEKVVLALLNRQPAAVRLQIELAQGKRISETAAGAYVDHEIIKLQNTHRDEMNGLKEQIADAEKRNKHELAQVLEEQYQKIMKEMNHMQTQREELLENRFLATETKLQEQQNQILLSVRYQERGGFMLSQDGQSLDQYEGSKKRSRVKSDKSEVYKRRKKSQKLIGAGQPLAAKLPIGLPPASADPKVKHVLIDHQFQSPMGNIMMMPATSSRNIIPNVPSNPGQNPQPSTIMNSANVGRQPGFPLGPQPNTISTPRIMTVQQQPLVNHSSQRIAAAYTLLQQNPGIINQTNSWPFPPSVLNPQIKQIVPPEVRTWAQLKHWVNMNQELAPSLDTNRIIILQAMHSHDLTVRQNDMARVEREDSSPALTAGKYMNLSTHLRPGYSHTNATHNNIYLPPANNPFARQNEMLSSNREGHMDRPQEHTNTFFRSQQLDLAEDMRRIGNAGKKSNLMSLINEDSRIAVSESRLNLLPSEDMERSGSAVSESSLESETLSVL